MKVWVTRDEDIDGPLCSALRARGLSPVLVPVVQRRVVDDLAGEIGELSPDDWLVLTSVYAVESVAHCPSCVPRVAVVGAVSGQAAGRRGFRVDLIGGGVGADALFDELRSLVRSGRVCYARSAQARVPEEWADVRFSCPVLYETCPCNFQRDRIADVDVVAVSSPSAVLAMRDAGIELSKYRIASIGPTTSAELRRRGVEPCFEARESRFASLADSIADFGK